MKQNTAKFVDTDIVYFAGLGKGRHILHWIYRQHNTVMTPLRGSRAYKNYSCAFTIMFTASHCARILGLSDPMLYIVYIP